jgi:hypothetical protein
LVVSLYVHNPYLPLRAWLKKIELLKHAGAFWLLLL